MLLVILLIALLAVAAASSLFLWIRRAASSGRTIDAPPGELKALFTGGVMSRHVITSGSLVRLEFFDWGIRLRGSAVSRWMVPTWEARYEEIAIAELVTLPHSRMVVWFRLRDGQGGIGFLQDGVREVLHQLEEHDVPVNRAVTQVRRVADLYHLPN